MKTKTKVAAILENAILIDLSVFIIFAPFSKHAVKTAFWIAVVLWVLISIVKFGAKFCKHLIPATPLNKALLFFFSALIVSTVFSKDFGHSQSVFFERYLVYLIFFLIGSRLAGKRRNLFILTGAFFLGSLLIGTGMIWDYIHLSGDRFLYTCFGRGFHVAFYLVLYICLSSAIVFFAENKLLKAGGLMILLLLLPGLIFHASRTAWITVLAMILVMSFIKNRKLLLCLFAALITGILLLSPLLKQRLPLLGERAVAIFDPVTWRGGEAWGGRIELWETALAIFRDFPVFGAGPGMYEKLLYEYGPAGGYPYGGVHLHAHNSYLEIASELGAVGFLAFLWIFTVFFRNAFKSIRLLQDNNIMAIRTGMTGSVLGILMVAMACTLMTVGMQDAAVFWFLLGMASQTLYITVYE